MNDIIVSDVPKYLTKNPTPESHAFVVPDLEFPGKTLTLPFHLDGVTSGLPCYKPTEADWDSERFPRINMTNEDLDWEPSTPRFADQEEAMTDWKGELECWKLA